MSKLIRLSPTGIEYGDYAWNFASGCGNNIDGKCKAGGFKCWAYSISQRFEGHYPNGFNPTVYPESFCSPLFLKKPSRILCAFMGDLFWDCPEFDPERKIEAMMPSGKASIAMSLKGWIYTTIKQCPQHTFLFLTKQPQNLAKFSPFPENCWVGVTATNWLMFSDALGHLASVQAKVKFLSLEPLLGEIKLDMLQQMLFPKVINQVIIGTCTGTKKDMEDLIKRYPDLTLMPFGNKWSAQPKIEWVEEIVRACDKVGVKVFLKDNLNPLFAEYTTIKDKWVFSKTNFMRGELYRQEMPDGTI